MTYPNRSPRHVIARSWRAVVTLAAATFWLSGCSVYQFDQNSMPVATPYQVTAPFHVDDASVAEWVMPESDAPRVQYSQTPAPVWYGYEEPFLANLPAIVTLSLIPIHGRSTAFSSAGVVWQEQVLWRHQVDFAAKTWTGMFFPTPFLIPGTSGEAEALNEANEAAQRVHLTALADQTRAQNERYAATDTGNPEALAQLLRSGDAPLLLPKGTARLIALAPPQDSLEFHAQYADLPGYVGLLPEAQQAWLIGPDGLKGWQLKSALADGESVDDLTRKLILAHPEHREKAITEFVNERWGNAAPHANNAVIRSIAEAAIGAYYKPVFAGLTDGHRQALIEGGLPDELVSYMNEQAPSNEMIAIARTGSLTGADGNPLTEEELLERLVRQDNAGQFMSPYTSDGVLAEWVNMATNANMGATAGSAAMGMAGAYVGNKVLDFVPFGLGGLVGGAITSELGEEGGREAAISASGGWEAIQSASDQSFDSLTNMAQYLKRKYGNSATYSDAITAASQIYPEFSSVLASTN